MNDWHQLLAVLEPGTTYESRLDALLDQVSALTGLAAVYLYVLDETGAHFHLERARASLHAGTGAVEGGAESIDAGPPLDLAVAPEDAAPRVVTTPVGALYSVPLHGVGLLQVGPLRRDSPPARARRALADSAFPLAHVVRTAREEERLRTRLASLTARVEAGTHLAGSALDLGRYVELLLELALRSTRTEAGFVAIVGDDGTLAIRAHSGLPPDWPGRIDLDPETGIFDWAPATEGGALILRSLEGAAEAGIRSLLAVPLLEQAQPLGVFALINFGDAGTFDAGSLELLATFADQIRQMLHNDRLFRDFSSRYLDTLKGLSHSLDVRRPHTHGHHERVARNAAALGAALGHDETEVAALHTAGLIHDAGMAGGDYQADVDHPTVGAALVDQLPLHPWVAAAVANHHEWWDGWGFPRGAAGEAIPRAGRILAAAEFLDELSSGDPVREPWGVDKLVAEVAVRGRTQLEPDVAEAAVRLLRENAFVLGGDT